ncbi:MAG: hypothetical protein FWC02_01380 [Firmicutes bacterium]|nr:hypothetical protein [Bacillota bacterium]
MMNIISIEKIMTSQQHKIASLIFLKDNMSTLGQVAVAATQARNRGYLEEWLNDFWSMVGRGVHDMA